MTPGVENRSTTSQRSTGPVAATATSLVAALLAVLLAACGGGKQAEPPPPPPAGPVISSVSPNHGALGAVVTVTASGLGTDPAAVRVTFTAPAQGAMTLAPVALAAGSLQVLVPAALAEQAQLTVTVAGQASAPTAFTLDALAPAAQAGATQAFLGDVDGILARLLPILDANLVPLLEQTGQATEAASVRSGLTTLRGAFAATLAATLAGKTPEQLAVLDAFFASPAAAAVKQELAGLLLELPAAPQGRVVGGAAPRPRLAASVGSGALGGFDSGSVESIEAAKRFLVRARDRLNALDTALLVAIGACAAADVAIPGAASLIPLLWEIHDSIVKPLLKILDAVIPLMGTFPTRVAGGTLRIQVTDHLLYNDQELGSMASPYPPGDAGVVLVTEPYGVKGYVTFKNDGGQSLRAAGADLLPSLFTVAEALAKLGGFEIGALEVTDAPTKLLLVCSDPSVIDGTWSDPSLWITAHRPGLVEVTIRAALSQVQETCAIGVGGQPVSGCIPAAEVQVTRTMHAMAGLQVTGPFTQGPRLDSVQAPGHPPATAFLGDELDVTGEGFSTNPQLAHQDVHLEPAPGYPLSGVAGSPYESFNRYESFKFVLPDALPGPMTVVLDGSPSNPIDFTVLPPLLDAPPASAIVGEYQRLTGKGFSEYASHNEGDWSGFRVPAEDGSHAWLDFTIPDGAQSGPFKVVTLGQLVSNEHPVVVRRWSEPALLSGGGRLALRPAVAFDRQSGLRITAWVERNATGATQLVASVLAAGAASAGRPVVLPARLGGHPAAPPRPAVAAGNGWLHVAWVERAPGPAGVDQVVTARSQDGVTWSTPDVLSAGPGPARQPALGADGALLVAAWVDEAAAEGGVGALRLRRSVDSGVSFGGALQWSGTTDVSDPAVAVRGGAVALAWSAEEVGGRAIVAMRSEDGGENYQPAWRLGASPGTGGLARHPAVAIGPSCAIPSIASVYLAWEQSASPAYVEDVLFTRLDGLATPATTLNVSQTAEHSQSPQLVVDDDCIPALAWLELGHARQRIFDAGLGTVAAAPPPATLLFARSFDGGATFNPRPMTLARNTLGDRLGHLAMAGGGQALLTVVHQDDFGGAGVAIRTTDGDGGSPPSQPPAPVGELSADLVYRGHGGALWVSAPDGRWPQRVTRGPVGTSAPGPSPDGRHLAWAPTPDQTWVAEADGAHAYRITATADFVWGGNTSWSPRGDWLAVGSPFAPPKLGWVRPDSTGFALPGTSITPWVSGASGAQPWSPDGRLAIAGNGLLQVLDPETGVLSALAAAAPGGFPGVPAYPAWSPDGAQLALVLAAEPALWVVGTLGTGDLYRYDLVTGALWRLTDDGRASTPAWSPDGRRVAFVRGDVAPRSVVVMAADAQPGQEVVLSNPFLDDDTEPTWLPDGRGLLVARRDLAGSGATLVRLDPATGAATVLSASPVGAAAVQHLGNRPTWPADATVTPGATGSSSVTLSWSTATDDLGVAWYQVWSGDTLVQDQVPGGATGTTVTGLTPETTYTFTILACDAAGNCTLTGPSVGVTTSAPMAPPTWSVVPPTMGRGTSWGSDYGGPYGLSFHFTPANENPVQYRIYVDGEATPRLTVAQWGYDGAMIDGLTPLATYLVTAQACHEGTDICTTDGPSASFTMPADDTPPRLGTAVVRAGQVTLTFDEPMDTASIPAAGDFLVQVGSPADPAVTAPVAVTSVGFGAGPATTEVVLTLAAPVVAGELAWVSFTPGAVPLRNLGGVPAAELLSIPLANGSTVTFSALAAAAGGDLVVAGRLAGVARFGAQLLIAEGVADAFVARRTPAGTWRWAVRLGGAGIDEALAVAVDPADDGTVVGGVFSGTIFVPPGPSGGGLLLVPDGAADAFVARLDADGGWRWGRRLGGAGAGPADDTVQPGSVPLEATTALAVGPGGSIYAAGRFSYDANAQGLSTVLPAQGYGDTWVARLDGAGTFLWATWAGSAVSQDTLAAVTADADSVFVAGGFRGSFLTPDLAPLFPGGTRDETFLARLDPATGAWLWVTDGDAGAPLPGGSAGALALDGAGGVFFGGGRTTWVSTWDSLASPHLSRWTQGGVRSWSVTGDVAGKVVGVAPQSDGSVLMAGSQSGNLVLGGVTITSWLSGDVFVARVGGDGAVVAGWPSDGGYGDTRLTALAAAPCGAGQVCLAGQASTYNQQSQFVLGPYTRSYHQADAWVGRLGSDVAFPEVGVWTLLFGPEGAP